MLEKLQPAPAFNSPDQNNENISLSDFTGSRNVVLYFYPKDDTPGCTIEASQFTALLDEFDALDTAVIGVSKDSCESHRAFIEKFGLRLKLLADTSGEVCDSFGVWQEKVKDGVSRAGIVRSTFIIDKNGRLADVEYGVTAEGHAQAVLEKIRRLQAAG